jgi:hypothetical protein
MYLFSLKLNSKTELKGTGILPSGSFENMPVTRITVSE